MVALTEGWQTQSEIATYYLNKGDKIQALKHYQSAYKTDNNNFDVIKRILLLQLDLNQYHKNHKIKHRNVRNISFTAYFIFGKRCS